MWMSKLLFISKMRPFLANALQKWDAGIKANTSIYLRDDTCLQLISIMTLNYS